MKSHSDLNIQASQPETNREPMSSNDAMQILICDDDYTSRAVLAGILKKGGYEVVETTNGLEAWQLLQQNDAPQLVILDWIMPKMDGPAVLERVRSLNTNCPPYIIMLTAKSEKPDIISGLDAGANDYLGKPFDPAELLARVEVGQRMVEMQLRLHRQRTNAQRYRVEASQRLSEMQDALASKTEELRRCQIELDGLAGHFQAVREKERVGSPCELHNPPTESLSRPHPGVLIERGLAAAIEWQAHETEKHTGLKCVTTLPANDIPLNQDCNLALFWIVQEAFANVHRHAQATEVETCLSNPGPELELQIQDNGRGYPPGLLVGSRALGLLGIRERAAKFGGTVEFFNEPGKGATIRLRCPMCNAQPETEA
jgi:DNA-binding response OmpR family regulator